MATQIVEIDRRAAPPAIRLRDDVGGILVVVTDGGRPVDLVQVPRPAGGVLVPRDVLRSSSWSSDVGPAPTPAPLSVVVCTRERPDDLSRCLGSLAGPAADGHEIIVVDSGPVTSRTREVAERFTCRYVVEALPGLDRARNAGTAAATHDVVAFVDDDVVVTEGWAAAIATCFTDPEVACATGLVLPFELETPAQEEFEVYCQHRRDLRRRVYSRHALRPSAAGIVGMGANMAYRRSVLVELGGFDLRLDAGTSTRSGGDTDMFARVLDSGRQIVYTPDARVWHRHRRSATELRACVFGYGVGLYGIFTKRLIEQHDVGALVTAARWLVGPLVKAGRARIARRPSPPWSVVLAETLGACVGPFCFAYETWRQRRRPVRLAVR